jgi:hypothetical protein
MDVCVVEAEVAVFPGGYLGDVGVGYLNIIVFYVCLLSGP